MANPRSLDVHLFLIGFSFLLVGLSANDLETHFLEAGGNGFIMKPFPCKPDLLRQELLRVLDKAETK